jgi:hypothetical protein
MFKIHFSNLPIFLLTFFLRRGSFGNLFFFLVLLSRCSHHRSTMAISSALVLLRVAPSLLLLSLITTTTTTTTTIISPVHGFIAPRGHARSHSIIEMSSSKEGDHDVATIAAAPRHPFCDLPGDPSLILTTNVDLGSKKLEIMKGV